MEIDFLSRKQTDRLFHILINQLKFKHSIEPTGHRKFAKKDTVFMFPEKHLDISNLLMVRLHLDLEGFMEARTFQNLMRFEQVQDEYYWIKDDEMSKANSSHKQEIDRIKKKLNEALRGNALRKKLNANFGDLVNKLLKEKRVTKEEVKKFIGKKKDVKL